MKRHVVCALLALVFGASSAQARVIHEERSLYRTILVTKVGAEVCLQFSVRRDQKNQSCINEKRPKQMVFSYTRMMMAALLLMPDPEKILMIGLGGGTVPMALNELLPDSSIDVVEIDPAVVRVAERFFGFAANDKMTVHVADARVFTKRAERRGDRYDLIFLDAYNGDYIPEHLMTREYLEETRALLSPRGVVAANTYTFSDLYEHESETYRQVFGPFYNLKIPTSANRIVLAARGALPDLGFVDAQVERWGERLRPYAVPLDRYPRSLSTAVDWDRDKRALTDQYSPANLLQR